MSDKRQKNQLMLAFTDESRSEAPMASAEGTESVVAKRGTESLAMGEQLMEEVCERENCKQVSRCTESPDLNAFVFKWFPGFSYNAIVPRAQTSVLKARTKFRLKIMRDLTTNDGDNRKLPRTVMRLSATRFVLDLNAVCSCESGI